MLFYFFSIVAFNILSLFYIFSISLCAVGSFFSGPPYLVFCMYLVPWYVSFIILLLPYILSCSFSSLFSSQSLPLPTSSLSDNSSVSLQKRAGLPGMSTKHGLTEYSKTQHKHSYQDWTRLPGSRKRVPSAGKSQRGLTLIVGSFTSHTTIRYIQRA